MKKKKEIIDPIEISDQVAAREKTRQQRLSNKLFDIQTRMSALQDETHQVIQDYLSDNPKERYTRSMERLMDQIGFFAAWIYDFPHGRPSTPDTLNSGYRYSMLYKVRRIFGIEDVPNEKPVHKIGSISRNHLRN